MTETERLIYTFDAMVLATVLVAAGTVLLTDIDSNFSIFVVIVLGAAALIYRARLWAESRVADQELLNRHVALTGSIATAVLLGSIVGAVVFGSSI